MPLVFAKRSNFAVHSRTCPTLPAAVGSSLLYIVWIESITNNAGCTSCACSKIIFKSVAVITSRFSPLLPKRLARIAVCASDSSPETYKTFILFRLNFMPASKSIVDLPMPGSPPNKTRLPGTIPPPSTRSNSRIPVCRRLRDCSATWCNGLGLAVSPTGR